MDLQRSFYDLAASGGKKLYHPDDNHWNELAVELAVDQLRLAIPASWQAPTSNSPIVQNENSVHSEDSKRKILFV